jgi:orotate phosphoribosyltransferase-like protein
VDIVVSEESLEKVQKLVREGKTVKNIADELKISYARAITYIRKIGSRITEQEEQLFNDIFKNAEKKLKSD